MTHGHFQPLWGGNSHDRRKCKRAHLNAARKQRNKTEAATLSLFKSVSLAKLKPQPAGFQFIEGASVRNKRTKSVATMLEHAGDCYDVYVKRGDNRKVFWPVDECENWNV